MAVAAGLAIVMSVGVASAATTTLAGTASTANSAVGPGFVSSLSCDELATAVTAVQRWSAVIGGDVATPGSTLWVQAQLQTAKDAGNTRRADRLQRALDNRTAHPDRWAKVLQRLQAAQSRRCS